MGLSDKVTSDWEEGCAYCVLITQYIIQNLADRPGDNANSVAQHAHHSGAVVANQQCI